MIKISIIVPIYNVEKYLRKCLESLIHQTLEEIEIILVDDASSDSSSMIMKEYRKKYNNIHCIFLEENLCLGGARNAGIALAKGEYLLFVDSDDYIEVSLCKKMYDKAQEAHSDMVYCNYNIVGEDGVIIEEKLIYPLEFSGKVTISKKRGLINKPAYACGKLFQRDLWIQNNIAFPVHLKYEDAATIPLFLMYINNCAMVCEPLYYYVKHKSSIMNKRNALHHGDAQKTALLFLKSMKERGLYFKFKDEVDHFVLERYYCIFLKRCLTKYDIPPLDKMQEALEYIEQNFPEYKYNKYYSNIAGEDRMNMLMNEISPEMAVLWSKKQNSIWMEEETNKEGCIYYNKLYSRNKERIVHLLKRYLSPVVNSEYRIVLYGNKARQCALYNMLQQTRYAGHIYMVGEKDSVVGNIVISVNPNGCIKAIRNCQDKKTTILNLDDYLNGYIEYGDTRLVIFGAGDGAIKVAQAFADLGVEVSYFVDNNSKKWGELLEGKKIFPPTVLLESSVKPRVIIASTYQDEISDQLYDMGLLNQLLLKEEVIVEYMDTHMEEFQHHKVEKTNFNKEDTVIVDLLDGFQFGVVESWTYLLVQELAKRDHKVKIYGKLDEKEPPEKIKKFCRLFEIDFTNYWNMITNLVTALVEELPCSVLINKQRQILIAGIIVKRLFPDKIKLVSISHSDKIDIYRRQVFFKDEIESIFCVSNDIRIRTTEEFGVNPEKVWYQPTPVTINEKLIRNYTIDSKTPLRIGYAGRLERPQKRADLLIPLIKELEKNRVNYQLEIAGDGTYYTILNEFIEGGELKNKIRVLGYLSPEEIFELWKRTDVYLSISDCEGASVAMLEAMAYGVVPVVTKVSGAREFVIENENGAVCEIGNLEQMAAEIKKIDDNREVIPIYGKRCRDIICKKCSIDEYITYIEDLL